MAERKKIPKEIKNDVYLRQSGKCACCINSGKHYHHILAAALIEGEYISSTNVMLLCEEHHELFHLGDPETYQSIYEYAWYIQNGELPEDKDLNEISEEVASYLKEKFDKQKD